MRLYLMFQTLRIIFNLVRPIKNLYKLTHNQTIMSSKAEAFRVCVCVVWHFNLRCDLHTRFYKVQTNVVMPRSAFLPKSSCFCTKPKKMSTRIKVGKPKTITKPKTTTMYHMHTFVASICMDLVHSGGFRFGDGFRYSYLTSGTFKASRGA